MSIVNQIINKLESNKKLNTTECQEFCDLVFQNKVESPKLTLILRQLNKVGFGADELCGFANSMRKISVKVKTDGNIVDNCGTGGDGSSTFNISTTASLVASCCNVKVAKHGNKSITSKSGSADLLMELGVNIQLSEDRISQCIEKHNFGFMFAPLHHGAMKYVAESRKEIAPEKTIFNLLGPLTNPAGAKRQLIGVFSDSVMHDVAETLIQLGVEKAQIVHSKDGLDELSIFEKTKILKIYKGDIIIDYFQPEKYFKNRSYSISDIKVTSPKESVNLVKSILDGTSNGAARDISILNAAFVLTTFHDDLDIADAIDLCSQQIEKKFVVEKINDLVEFTNATS